MRFKCEAECLAATHLIRYWGPRVIDLIHHASEETAEWGLAMHQRPAYGADKCWLQTMYAEPSLDVPGPSAGSAARDGLRCCASARHAC